MTGVQTCALPILLGDGMLGQIMEAVTLPPMKDFSNVPNAEWATDGTRYGADRRVVNSLYIQPDDLEAMNHKLFAKYDVLAEKECRYEEYLCDDADVIITAYGTVARIAKSAVDMLRASGVKAGLLRPITLFPFPCDRFARLAAMPNVKKFVSVELSMGQMVEDVRLSVNGMKPVEFYGRCGGNVMTSEDIAEYITKEGK